MHYGGLNRPQILKGTALPFSVARAERQIELEGSIPLYKLHGSLNWGLEAGVRYLYQDSRPAFRYGGDAQIVPPVLEKESTFLATGRLEWRPARTRFLLDVDNLRLLLAHL